MTGSAAAPKFPSDSNTTDNRGSAGGAFVRMPTNWGRNSAANGPASMINDSASDSSPSHGWARASRTRGNALVMDGFRLGVPDSSNSR